MVTTEFTLSLSSHARSYNRLVSYILSEQSCHGPARLGSLSVAVASLGDASLPRRFLESSSSCVVSSPCLLASSLANFLGYSARRFFVFSFIACMNPYLLGLLLTRFIGYSLPRILACSPSRFLVSLPPCFIAYSLPRLLASSFYRLLLISVPRLLASSPAASPD